MLANDSGFAGWFVAWSDDEKRVRLKQGRPATV
jgi:hypothetical protein